MALSPEDTRDAPPADDRPARDGLDLFYRRHGGPCAVCRVARDYHWHTAGHVFVAAEEDARGALTTAEAQVVYMALGERPTASGWSSHADLATKVVVTEVLGTLAATSPSRWATR